MSFRLSADQAGKVLQQLFKAQNYLVRLRKRMKAVGVADDDPIFRAVIQADEAMVTLRLHLHGRACGKER